MAAPKQKVNFQLEKNQLVAATIFISSIRAVQTEVQVSAQINTCTGTANFTLDSTYGANLNNLLLPSLSSNARTRLFYNGSFGTDQNVSEAAFGLFLCRGDITADACHDCVVRAIQDIRQRCGNEREAVIWFDKCMLRYANRNIFAMLETRPKVYMFNTFNVSNDATERDRFVLLVRDTMTNLAPKATDGGLSDKKFATEEVYYTPFIKVYFLLECTPDLSRGYCSQCLQVAIADLHQVYNGTRGLRAMNPSCTVRYELYRFYSDPAPPPAPPPNLHPSPPTTGDKKALWNILGSSLSAIFMALLLGSYIFYRCRRKKQDQEEQTSSHEIQLLGENISDGYSNEDFQGNHQGNSLDFPSMPLNIIMTATQNFSDENKLGEGGFGPVYNGILVDGKEIAVKRLSKTSGQGFEEFKNEISLIAKLQHRNLVRLLGCCLEAKELLLIYEYMPNKSLDVLLFDASRSAEIDWNQRFVIINGIARGLLYLHEDSRLRIIHRDLKTSNILLDQEMNPKISDFEMARIFGGNQVEASTNRVMGTYGYMAPEYAMEGLFSIKSDVYSYGVLLLEIISGKRNGGLFVAEYGKSLLSYAWMLWCDNRGLELTDRTLEETYTESEVLKCIQIGLLCVQDDPADRPTMASVVFMLRSDNITLPKPTQPLFLVGRPVTRPAQPSSANEGSSLGDFTISIVSPR